MYIYILELGFNAHRALILILIQSLLQLRKTKLETFGLSKGGMVV